MRPTARRRNIVLVDRYRLGPVRDVRARDERAKRGDLAAAVGDARGTADEVATAAGRATAARAAIDAARGVRDALVAAGSSPALLVLAERFTARCRRDLDAALGEQLRAEATHAGQLAQLDAARGRLVQARAQREIIERHFARWRETQRKLADRRED